MAEYAEVPLVVYIRGKRHVIGTATLNGNVVKASFESEVGDKIVEAIMQDPQKAHFSLGFHDWSVPDDELDEDKVLKEFPVQALPALRKLQEKFPLVPHEIVGKKESIENMNFKDPNGN